MAGWGKRWTAPVSDSGLAEWVRGLVKSGAGRGKRVPVVSAPVPPERDVLAAVLAAVVLHRGVGWAVRMNTGMAEFPDPKGGKPRRVRFAFKGCSDILGQMKSGRFLAIEVKRPGKKPTADQLEFLDRVDSWGGVACWCDNAADAVRFLDHAIGPSERFGPPRDASKIGGK
jgi:hypothetical protein